MQKEQLRKEALEEEDVGEQIKINFHILPVHFFVLILFF